MIRVVIEAVAAYLVVVFLLLVAWYVLKRRDREEVIAEARTRLCPPDDPAFIAWAAEQDK